MFRTIFGLVLLFPLFATFAQTEEQILKSGGPEAEKIIRKASALLGRGSTFEVPLLDYPEACWALTVVVRYQKREKSAELFHDILTYEHSTAAQKLYAFAGLRLLGGEYKVKPEELWPPEFFQTQVMFVDGCTGSSTTVREILKYLDDFSYENLLLDPLPRLYQTQ